MEYYSALKRDGRMRYHPTCFHSMSLEDAVLSERARHFRLPIVGFPCCELSRRGQVTETGRSLVIPRCWEPGKDGK